MKSILISVKPEWVAKILNGEKTIEIRKTMPKCKLPCKVYIYCTKGKQELLEVLHKGEIKWFGKDENDKYEENIFIKQHFSFDNINKDKWLGKVVAEFVLNKITKHEKNYIDVEDNLCYNFLSEDVKNAGFINSYMDDWEELDGSLSFDRFVNIYGDGKPLYAWHIDDLKIYDTPKGLCEFSKHGFESLYGSSVCGNSSCPFYLDSNTYDLPPECLREEQCQIIRPPQSWCYVEAYL